MSVINIGKLEKVYLLCRAGTGAQPTARYVPERLQSIMNWSEWLDPRLLPLAKVLEPFLSPGAGQLDRNPVDAALSKILDVTVDWWKEYIPLLRFIRDEMDRFCPRVLVNMLPGVLATCSAELNALAQFACVNWKAYEGCLRGDKEKVRTRELLRTEEEKAIFNKMSMLSVQKKYDLHTIQSAGALTLEAKSGVCTTFGLTAASILAEKACAHRARVELVAFRGNGGMAHCFVIVGRNNGDLNKEGRIPTPSKGNIESWGSQCYVVDPWAASLGSECISLWHEYDHGGFLFQLERTWCSIDQERPTCEVAIRVETSSQSCPKCKSKNLEPYSSVEISSGMKCLACGHVAKQSDFSEVGRSSTVVTCKFCKGTTVVSFDRGKSWKCADCKQVWPK